MSLWKVFWDPPPRIFIQASLLISKGSQARHPAKNLWKTGFGTFWLIARDPNICDGKQIFPPTHGSYGPWGSAQEQTFFPNTDDGGTSSESPAYSEEGGTSSETKSNFVPYLGTDRAKVVRRFGNALISAPASTFPFYARIRALETIALTQVHGISDVAQTCPWELPLCSTPTSESTVGNMVRFEACLASDEPPLLTQPSPAGAQHNWVGPDLGKGTFPRGFAGNQDPAGECPWNRPWTHARLRTPSTATTASVLEATAHRQAHGTTNVDQNCPLGQL